MFVGDDGLPLWARTFCHVAEVLCHAIITSGLVGIAMDFTVALLAGRAMSFCTKAVTCTDSVESHSVVSDIEPGTASGNSCGLLPCREVSEPDASDPFQTSEAAACKDELTPSGSFLSTRTPARSAKRNMGETFLLWLSFVFSVACFVLAERGQLWTPLLMAMVWLGVVCWAGIAWWIVSNLVDCSGSCVPS